jgi:hypothetical protein
MAMYRFIPRWCDGRRSGPETDRHGFLSGSRTNVGLLYASIAGSGDEPELTASAAGTHYDHDRDISLSGCQWDFLSGSWS